MRTWSRQRVATLALCLVAPLFMTDSSQARGLDKIRNIKFTIANLNDQSAACGLTEEDLRSAFLAPLQGSGIKITTSSAYFFYIKTTTVTYIEDTCITYVDAELLLTERYFNPATGSERTGLIRKWLRGGLRASGKAQHAKAVSDVFNDLGAEFRRVWERDQ